MNSRKLKRNSTISFVKRRHFLSLMLVALFAPGDVFASEVVHAFTSHIEINKNGSADVQEEIVYDFGDAKKHGILREIPLLYQSAGDEFSHNVEITSISITDGRHHTIPAQYDQEGSGNVAVLKIGDAETLLTGTQLYVIRYTLWCAELDAIPTDEVAAHGSPASGVPLVHDTSSVLNENSPGNCTSARIFSIGVSIVSPVTS